jgi:hypothetical protein
MLTTLITRLREYGIVETAFLGARWVGFLHEVHSLEFFLRDLGDAGHQPSTASPHSDVRCAEYGAPDLARAKLATGLPTAASVEATFKAGSRLFVAIKGDEVVAYSWLNTKAADLTFIRKPSVALPAGFAYSHGVLVAPAYQGQGLGGVLKSFGCSSLSQEGVRYVVAAVFLWNRRALHWHRHVMGESHWGRITHVRLKDNDYWVKLVGPAGRRHRGVFDTHTDQRDGEYRQVG